MLRGKEVIKMDILGVIVGSKVNDTAGSNSACQWVGWSDC